MALAQALVSSFQWVVPVLTVFQISLAQPGGAVPPVRYAGGMMPAVQQADDFAQSVHIATGFLRAFEILLKLGSKGNLAHDYRPR